MSKQPVPASLAHLRINTDADAEPDAPVNTDKLPAGTKAIILRVTPALHEELRQAAFRDRTTISYKILMALEKDGYKVR